MALAEMMHVDPKDHSARPGKGHVARLPLKCVAWLALFASAASSEAQSAGPGTDQISGRQQSHEVSADLLRRMTLDEHFRDLPAPRPLKGITAYGGTWRVQDGVLLAGAGPGPKLICHAPAFGTGEVGVEG